MYIWENQLHYPEDNDLSHGLHCAPLEKLDPGKKKTSPAK